MIDHSNNGLPNSVPAGRILALDPGTKRCGIAVSDELQITTRAVRILERHSWKKLLIEVKEIISALDARALVVGLPLESDGSDGEMTSEARSMASKFSLSLDIPVFLQDERGTSYEARGRLWSGGASARHHVDADAAAIILADFLDRTAGLPRA